MKQQNNQYPSKFEQAKSLISLVQDTIVDVMKGEQVFSTDELKEQRMAICKSCDQYNEKHNRCMKCGCFLDKKVSLSSARCPLNKWDGSETGSADFYNLFN